MIDLTLITKFTLSKYIFIATIIYGIFIILRKLIKGD